MHAQPASPDRAYPRDVPEDELYIAHFRVRQLAPDLWEATADYELTDFMADMGCRAIVRAETPSDLELLALTERLKTGHIRAAAKAAGSERAES